MQAVVLILVLYFSWKFWMARPEDASVGVYVIGLSYVIGLFLLLGGVFGFLLLINLPLLALLLMRQKHRAIYVDRRIAIGDISLGEEVPNGYLESKWSDIPKIAKTKNLIIVYHDRKRAHLIPRRAFQTSGEFDLFFHEIKSRFIAAREVDVQSANPSESG